MTYQPMRERPILFSGPMVRAILEGRKTVTRRVIKPGFPTSVTEVLPYVNAPGAWIPSDPHNSEEPWDQQVRICPYGQPGDRLWVREAWAADAQVNTVAPRDLSHGEPILFPADGSVRQTGCSMFTPGKTRPSIHMPRWASRILLEVTAVRVERLQGISQGDALAEGVMACERDLDPDGNDYSPYELFSMLWVSINGHDSWSANPWVWAVDFKRVEVPHV